MNALCAIGLLRKKAEKFSNTPLTLRFLVKGKPGYMAGFMHMVSLWNSWGTLTQVKEVVLMLDLSRVKRALDVGAGSGAYTMAFARAKEDIRATTFDLPNVIGLTRNYIKKEGLL